MTPAICPCCGYDLTPDVGAITGDFAYDRVNGVSYLGQRLPMQPQCHEILGALMRAAGGVVSRKALHERIGYEGDCNIADVRLTGIRRTLRQVGAPDYLDTVRGVGMRWVAP